MVSVTQQFDEMLNPKKKREGDTLAAESTSIDGGGTSTGAAGAPASTDYTKSTYQSPSKIMKANTQSSGVDLTGTYEEQASKVRTSLKTEKDGNYKKLNDARVQSVDQGSFDSAVDGDEAAQGKVSNVLNGKFQKPKYESSTSTDISDIDSLQNSGGIAALLRQRGGDNYTSGMANLDARLFQNNPMAGEQINKARDIARGVRKEGQDQQSAFEKDADGAESEFTGSQKTLRDMLEGRGSNIMNTINQRKVTDEQAGKDWQTADAKRMMDQSRRVLNEFPGSSFDADLGQKFNAESSGVALQPFMKAGSRTGSTMTEAEARQLNNVDRLLNRGGEMRTASNISEQAGSFDEAGYREALKNVLTKYQGEQGVRQKFIEDNPTVNTSQGGQIIEGKEGNRDPINIPQPIKDVAGTIANPIDSANEMIVDPINGGTAWTNPVKGVGSILNEILGGGPESDLPEGSTGGGFETVKQSTTSNPTGAPTIGTTSSGTSNGAPVVGGAAWANDKPRAGGRPKDTPLVVPPPSLQAQSRDTNQSSGDMGFDQLVALVGDKRAREIRNLPPAAAAAEAPGQAESWEASQARLAQEKADAAPKSVVAAGTNTEGTSAKSMIESMLRRKSTTKRSPFAK